MFTRLFYFILCVIALGSCKKEKLHQTPSILNADTKSHFIIKDTNSSAILNYAYNFDLIKTDSLNFIVGLNSYYNKMEVLDLNNSIVKKEIDFLNEPEYILHNLMVDDFYYHNLDSIFLYSSKNQKIAIMDIEGNLSSIIKLIDAIESFHSSDFMNPIVASRRNIFYDSKNKNVLLRSLPPLNFYRDKPFYDKPFIVSYNIERDEMNHLFGLFSDPIKEGNDFLTFDYQNTFLINFETNSYIVSHRRDHSLYEYELYSNKLIREVSARSNYLDKFELVPREYDSQVISDALVKDGNYTNLIFNKYTNEYYRVVLHNQDLINTTTKRVNHPINKREFSVIVFDKELKSKGEMIFENPTFNFFDIVPSEEGLSTIYKDNENENIIHFETFQINN